MNRTALKNYAPQARRDFIQAMTDRAAHYGITASKVEPLVLRGDAVVIAGKEFPKVVAAKRSSLEERIKRDGFGPTVEAIAYTWFNRLAALRFMELHGYLEHGYRVLSHPEGKASPEVLEHAQHLELPGLQQDAVIDLKMAGDREDELYRLILLAQCHALHQAMPFLFERIDDETELLLPEKLLHSDGLIRKLVEGIAEEDWQQVEVIGWLYQFYISERKDEVIGKVVASEDIPAATQLFTPNWIVKYLVQNTLGRQWLATYPDSPLRQQMEYYIEPAEQTPEVQAQLKAITPTSLNPEELTFLDPACGSGHILVEAYDLFKAIYQERGYRAKDIPGLILKKNLYGLEIDDRAAQLASFALMMKARADDRRLFESDAKPNIVALQESKGLDAAAITHALNSPINKDDVPKEFLFEEIEEEEAGLFSKKVMAQKGHVSQGDIAALVELFEHAKTFGSLIVVPPKLAAKLPEIENRLTEVLKNGDLTHVPAQVLKPLLLQTGLLARQYDAVVANPPYMGGKLLCEVLKNYLNENYRIGKADLYGAFMLRNMEFSKGSGLVGMITIPNWLTISSFEALRKTILLEMPIASLVDNGRGVWGSDFGSCAFVLQRKASNHLTGRFLRLFEKAGSVAGNDELRQRFFSTSRFNKTNADFSKIPGSPIAYWLSERVTNMFVKEKSIGERLFACVGLQTSDNGRFMRLWHEVSIDQIGFGMCSIEASIKSEKKWFPSNKGGEFRKWYGNLEYVVNWQNDGQEIREFQRHLNSIKKPTSRMGIANNSEYYFREAVSWSDITISRISFRFVPQGCISDVKGNCAFEIEKHTLLAHLAYLNTEFVNRLSKVLNPTVSFPPGYFKLLPSVSCDSTFFSQVASSAISISKDDWDSNERSWDFQSLPILFDKSIDKPTLEKSWTDWVKKNREKIDTLLGLEEEINRRLIETCGLEDEFTPNVSIEQISLLVNPAYRYGDNLNEMEKWFRFRQDSIEEIISYAIGCVMGRYSLDKPGLIYAYSGNQGFDPSQYQTFRADDDGIIPLLDNDWGIRDDATNRLIEFVGVAWYSDHLDENLKFIADSLDPESKETPRETIRHYLSTGFYKHHLSMYKKRPIYWLFSSGKQRAFQCLVYLHRYNEGTLSRMRTEYVIPLLGKISGRIDQLEGDKVKATSTAHRKKLQKEQDDLIKQRKELNDFDEKLKNYADQQIKLDLDDGVRVNYAKFATILAEVKAVTGGGEE